MPDSIYLFLSASHELSLVKVCSLPSANSTVRANIAAASQAPSEGETGFALILPAQAGDIPHFQPGASSISTVSLPVSIAVTSQVSTCILSAYSVQPGARYASPTFLPLIYAA